MEGLKHNLRAFLSRRFILYRIEHNISQEQMATLLHVSPRSYVDLEHGKYLCSTIVFISFLALFPKDEQLLLIVQLISILIRFREEVA